MGILLSATKHPKISASLRVPPHSSSPRTSLPWNPPQGSSLASGSPTGSDLRTSRMWAAVAEGFSYFLPLEPVGAWTESLKGLWSLGCGQDGAPTEAQLWIWHFPGER